MGARRRRKNQPHFDLRREQIRISGVDLTQIDGIDTLIAQTILTEVGGDVSAFPSEKEFSNWLGLAPNHRITGGRILSRRTRPVRHRLSTALRLAAQSAAKGRSAIAGFYRRMASRMDKPAAITATAHRIAVLVYRMLKWGKPYVDIGKAAFEQRHKQIQIANLKRSARRLGFALLDPQTGELVTA
jgi:transposase